VLEVDAELEALWSFAALVRDLVLEGHGGTSSLAALLSSVVELIEHHVEGRDYQWGRLGDPVSVGCRLVTHPRVGDQA
jgi:hypothetical protein